MGVGGGGGAIKGTMFLVSNPTYLLVDRKVADFCILQNPKCHHRFTDREGNDTETQGSLLKQPALERLAWMSPLRRPYCCT